MDNVRHLGYDTTRNLFIRRLEV